MISLPSFQLEKSKNRPEIPASPIVVSSNALSISQWKISQRQVAIKMLPQV
jgi:hypothetical protein